MLEHGAEGCNYLLAVDVEMETVGGYAMASWDTGYGDFEMVPDLETLRLVPWLPGTAMVMADVQWADGREVAASPRQILRRQLARLAERGMSASAATELEFIVFRDTYEEAWKKGFHDLEPANLYNIDYSLLGTARVEPLIRRIRNEMAGGGDGGRELQGRVQPRPARDQLPLRRRAAQRRRPRDLQERRQGDRLPGGALDHLHGQVQRARGQLVPHPLLAGEEDGSNAFAADQALFEHFVAGQLACMEELTLLYAPHVNSYKRFAKGSFAPTAIAWGRDNRTCSLRVVGHGEGLRVENRLPGADVNPYLALSAMIAAGLHGIDAELPLEEVFEGNAYESDKPRVPSNIYAARDAFAASEVARGGLRRRGRRPLPEPGRGRDRGLRGGRHRLGALPGLRAALSRRDRRAGRSGSAPRSSGSPGASGTATR